MIFVHFFERMNDWKNIFVLFSEWILDFYASDICEMLENHLI